MTRVGWLACSETDQPASDEWLSQNDRVRLASMKYAKRYSEARLSRWTAQLAVALHTGLGEGQEAATEVTISNAPDGSPRAVTPTGSPISISSTDRAGWAVTAVVDGEMPIGCDLELTEPRSRLFVRDYFTEAEQEMVAAETESTDQISNLIWSAKESVLKVLRTGLRRDTRSVDVRIAARTVEQWTALEMTADGRLFHGWWRAFGPFILTMASIEPLQPPVSLVEPSPLETASPAHTWMQEPLRH